MQLYLTNDEVKALSEIDPTSIDTEVEKALDSGHASGLRRFRAFDQVRFLSSKLVNFEKSLAEYRGSKAARKKERTLYDARRAGTEISYAVSGMVKRMEDERKERQLFEIDDRVFPAIRGSRNMRLTVQFKWRGAVEEEWQHGSITFFHTARDRDHDRVGKVNNRKRADELERELLREWEHFQMLATHSVREFFQTGGDRSSIPGDFTAVMDGHSGGLNNFSLNFWKNLT